MKEPFSVALAAFMARHTRRSLTERINALREQTMVLELDRDAKTPKCRDCTWRQICRGGSVASAFCASGQIYSPDAYCDAYLDVFPRVAVALADLLPAGSA